MRFIDEKSLDRLDFKILLNKVEVLSPYGNDRLKKLKIFARGEEDKLNAEFNKMEEFAEFSIGNRDLIRKVELCIHKMKNIRNILKNSLKGNILDSVDFFEIKVQAMLMQELNSYLRQFPEALLEYELNDINEIIEVLDPDGEKIPTFYIYDSYSPELKKIREAKKEKETKIFATKDLEEKTKLKEERLQILVEEEKEELKIREELTKTIYKYSEKFLENIEHISDLDFLMAKVRFAKEYKGIRPEISTSLEIEATNLVNLQVKEMLKAKGKEFTPIDIKLGSGVTVITGANMGGKSVALKTVTENLLLFNMGFFVIADKAKFPLVDFIFFISDDMQDISKGLSTFGAEIVKLREVDAFIERGNGFIVFDEFARGTNPKEGQKFVKALVKFLNDRKTISIITTHFDGIATSETNHYQVVGLKNVDFDRLKRKIEISENSMSLIQDYMDFRLEKCNTSEVPKDALNIAKLIGINKRFNDIILEEYDKED